MLQNNHPEGGNDRFQVINFHLFVAGAIPRVAGRKERRQDCRNNPHFCMDLQRRSQVKIYFFAQEAVLHSDSIVMRRRIRAAAGKNNNDDVRESKVQAKM